MYQIPKFTAALFAVSLLTGCLEVPDNAFREISGGAKEVQISEGRNCWMNQCFRYDAGEQTLSVTGREPIEVPDGVDLSDGFVTEAEFEALVAAARAADRVKRPDDENDAGGSVNVDLGTI